MKNLSEREQKILSYMKKQIQKKGYPPTVREICTALDIKSTSTTHKDIEALAEKGYIEKDSSKPRALTVKPEKPMPESSFDGFPDRGGVERTDIVDVPLIGSIAAGTPVLAVEHVEDTFPVPARYVRGGVNFMLTVRGESMVNVGILDGDYILVEQQDTASNGDIVVAMIDGFESEATVKTFYKESDHIRLQPENDAMSPIIVHDVKILGKVKGVFRYF